MFKLTNHGRRSYGLAGQDSVVLAQGESKEVTDDHLDDLLANTQTKGWIDKGYIEMTYLKGVVEPERPTGVVIEQSGSWYRVYVAGIDVAGKSLRKAEAEALADEYV